MSLGLKWNLKGKKLSLTCALRAEKGACKEEKVEGSRLCCCCGLIPWLLNEVPPWNVAFETTAQQKKRMLPLPFHPNQSSTTLLSFAFIFVSSSSFCFSPWLCSHTPETLGQLLWSSQTKAGAAALGPTWVLSASGLS